MDPAVLLDLSAVRKIAVLLASSVLPPSLERPLKVELLEVVVVLYFARTRTPARHTCASSCAQSVYDRIHPSLPVIIEVESGGDGLDSWRILLSSFRNSARIVVKKRRNWIQYRYDGTSVHAQGLS